MHPIQPIPHVSGPFLNQGALDEGEGKSNPGQVGLEGQDLMVESEVGS